MSRTAWIKFLSCTCSTFRLINTSACADLGTNQASQGFTITPKGGFKSHLPSNDGGKLMLMSRCRCTLDGRLGARAQLAILTLPCQVAMRRPPVKRRDERWLSSGSVARLARVCVLQPV